MLICQTLSPNAAAAAASSACSTSYASHASDMSPPGSLQQRASQGLGADMATGPAPTDGTVLVAYIQRLDEHRKLCELNGRYAEAKAAVKRIQDLRRAQAERLRAELLTTQHSELAHLQQTFEDDKVRFEKDWHARIAEYEQNLATQLAALKGAHEVQVDIFAQEAEAKRPEKPKLSAEYLNQRKIEEKLVKQGQYRKAFEVKTAADAMYYNELSTTQAAYEADMKMKQTKLLAKQHTELEVLLQRASRGRDELELRRLDEADRRRNKFKKIMQELDTMDRLEVVHLDNFLNSQSLSGVYVPLRDSTFRRKREILMAQQISRS
eukprot:jgi/Chrzof1/12235/Cz06g26160.t1